MAAQPRDGSGIVAPTLTYTFKDAVSLLGSLYIKAGAQAMLNRVSAMPSTVFVPPTSLAWIHLGLGETDEFFERMNEAIDARDHMIMPIKTYPFLDPIRADARFLALLRKMHLDD